MDSIFAERFEALKNSRWDIYTFIGAFSLGVIVYLGLRLVLRALAISPMWTQLIITMSIIGVMLLYALAIGLIPRLRVRLDQAGDNAYYLGLLFTLLSMAVALWEFGNAIALGTSDHEMSGVRQIISNFGVALASTITGIFLRILMHQMRVDPADVESMTRIEMAGAAKQLKSNLDVLTNDLERFHQEVKQKTGDVLYEIAEDTNKSNKLLNEGMQQALNEIVLSSKTMQQTIFDRISQVTQLLDGMASEAINTIARFKAIEPPPLTLSRRLDRISNSLESMGNHFQQLTTQLEGTTASVMQTAEEMAKVSSGLVSVSKEIAMTQNETGRAMTSAVEQVSVALGKVGEHLRGELTLLNDLEAQSRRSAEEAARAQTGSIEVLKSLTEVTRGLTMALRSDINEQSDV